MSKSPPTARRSSSSVCRMARRHRFVTGSPGRDPERAQSSNLPRSTSMATRRIFIRVGACSRWSDHRRRLLDFSRPRNNSKRYDSDRALGCVLEFTAPSPLHKKSGGLFRVVSSRSPLTSGSRLRRYREARG